MSIDRWPVVVKSRIPGLVVLEHRVYTGDDRYGVDYFVDKRTYRWIGLRWFV